MFPRAIRLASVGGVDVRVDPSLLIIAALVAVQFWLWSVHRYGHDGGTAVVLAVAATLLFLGSILAHELGHALEATHRGVAVGGITLFLFGGVTETQVPVRRPRDEFALSAVGPYVSLVLAALFGVLATWAAFVGVQAAADIAGLLGWLNLFLGLFNLLPGAPLDGGRVLRSLIWAVTGDRARAARYAARSGQVLAGLLVVAAGVSILVGGASLVVQAVWSALIGWFLFRAAAGELRQGETVDLLRDRAIGSLLPPPPAAIDADAAVLDVLEDLARSATDAHPVVERNGQLVGVLRLEDAAEVAGPARVRTTVRQVMCPLERVAAFPAHLPVTDVLHRLEDAPAVAAFSDGELVGLVSDRGLRAALERLRRLHGPVRAAPRGPAVTAERP